MVAIAPQHRAGIGLMPVGEDQVEVVRRLLLFPAVEHLVHDQEAHAVGQLQQLGRRRVMAHADGVGAHVAQDFQLALGRADIEGSAERAQVMMIVDATQGNRRAIDDDALVRIEPHVADAEARFIAVDDAAALRHGGDGDIAVGRLRGRRTPQAGIGQDRAALKHCLAARRDAGRLPRNAGDRPPGALAGGVERVEAGRDLHLRRAIAVIVDRQADVDACPLLADLGRAHDAAPLAHMDLVRGGEENVAIQAAARIPARRSLRIVEADGELVAAAGHRIGRQV